MKLWMLTLLLVACAAGCGPRPERPDGEALWVTPDIEERRAQFVPEPISADISHLSAGDRTALRHLVAAARVMHDIFAVQAWPENPEFAERVAALEGPGAEAARDYYRIMVGPWDGMADH